MDFLKAIILVASFTAYLSLASIASENVDLVYDKNEYLESTQKVSMEEYGDMPEEKKGLMVDRVILALEYSGWISEPLEDVVSKFEELYGEPLLSEILQSVAEFREIPTGWAYFYKVDNVYLVEKDGERIYLIAHVLELLNDEIIDELRMLVILNKDLKIIEKQSLK